MSLAVIIRKYLGWCPMAAAAQQVPGGKTAEAHQPQRAADAGPVARRALLFSRLTFAIAGLSWIVALAALPYLPETIPVHWNIYGEADGFSGQLTGAFGLPALITLTAAFLVVLPRFDRMREAFEDSRDIYAMVTFSTVSLILGIQSVAMLSAVSTDVPVAVAFPILLGFFFMVIGSLMPYVRRNTTIGFRLPWTIRDDTVWKRTHEHGGTVFILAGVLMVIVSAGAGARAAPFAIGILLAAVLYVSVWSYRLSRVIPAGKEKQ